MDENNGSSLGHRPSSDRWTFDDGVTAVFPDMLQRSIPQYGVMRQTVVDIGANFVQPSTFVLDLGCSRGDALAPFVSIFDSANSFLGIDKSAPMIKAARARFSSEIARGIVSISDEDMVLTYPQVRTSLTLCILTLQFIPQQHRQRILTEAYRNTVPGGALILVEKVLGTCPRIDDLMVGLYHELKRNNGYSKEEIEQKSESLKGVLIPLTAQENDRLLRAAGFQEVDCFWRWMNFMGFVALKQN